MFHPSILRSLSCWISLSSVIFDGTFKDDASGFEFSGNASADGSYGIQDGFFVLEGTVQANGESASGIVPYPVELVVQFATALPSSI